MEQQKTLKNIFHHFVGNLISSFVNNKKINNIFRYAKKTFCGIFLKQPSAKVQVDWYPDLYRLYTYTDSDMDKNIDIDIDTGKDM